ncbi:DUF916 domain-containing protein [Lacticaseibacillus nasuensis]|uniref:DUF916 domain-containing protein n=1 Tax=Lacticaseibacillus nasuensis TaxID=944671 RepID=UPI0022468C4D|nr:DUF916 domain-containing protein [Lacticaseibacillus nasuensis]MCX2456456.1 DUF916 and DUF3324 domain-containing protein [Lacticaseibacillus nasuensis]
MRIRPLLWWLVGVALVLVGGNPQPVRAAGAEFTVTPVLNAAQRAGVTDYFDLDVTPGHPQTLKMMLHNEAKTPETFTIGANPAYTSDGGAVAYDRADPTGFTGEYSMHKLVTGPTEVTLAAGESRQLTYHLTPPANTFGGIISGALYVRRELDADNTGSGVTLQNRYAFALPIRLHSGSNLGTAPSLRLLAASGEPLSATIENPSPHQFGEISLTLTLVARATGKTVWTQTWSQLAVAPTSRFTLTPAPPVLKAGQYQLTMSAKSGEYTWQGSRQFTLSAAAAAQQAAANQPVANSPWGSLTFFAIAVLVALAAGAGGWAWHWRRQRGH